jgi:hypothetical protein
MENTDRGFGAYGRREHPRPFERFGEQLLDYLRSRTVEHWLMFLAGLVVGLVLS